MKLVTLATSVGCILLLMMSSAQARPHPYNSHRHIVVEKKVVVRAAPVRAKINYLATHRLAALPAGFVRLSWVGETYYYVNGLYYMKQGRGYGLVRPVAGLAVASLPSSYTRVRIGGDHLYRYNEVNYRKINGFFIVV